jgi:pimeloyl-ACP methyl ester carboxylesterase
LVGGLGDAQTFTRNITARGFKDTLGWRENAAKIQAVWLASEQAGANAAEPQSANPVEVKQKYTGDNQGTSVYCAESPNPRNAWIFPALAEFAADRSGVLGPYYAWNDEQCAQWPAWADERYSGPWDHWTANPILVIGNTYDPSTAYSSSVIMSKVLARARLLTVDGYGHTVMLNPSACASEWETDYFINGMLPPKGTVCKQDKMPFDPEP